MVVQQIAGQNYHTGRPSASRSFGSLMELNAMTFATARARAKHRHASIEERLGGAPGDLVAAEFFDPRQTAAHIFAGHLTPEIADQVVMGAEFLPRARRGEADCLLCRKPLDGWPAMIGWVQLLAGGLARSIFGICLECARRPDVEARLLERLNASKVTIN